MVGFVTERSVSGGPTNNILPHSNLNRSENDMLTRMPFLPSGFRRTNLPPRRVAPQAVLEEHIRSRLRILPEEVISFLLFYLIDVFLHFTICSAVFFFMEEKRFFG